MIASVDCFAVLRRGFTRGARRVFTALALVVLVAAYGLTATVARAGTQTSEPNDADPLAASSPAPSQMAAQQAAATEQAAGAAASATQQQPRNIVITVRVNSPGDDGPISQTNVVVAGANGSNSATTNQSGAPGAAAPAQSANTGQQAGATATTSQDGAGNLVVVVRINSPGNNGSITQSNAAVSGANARNTSATNQAAVAPTARPAAAAAERAPVAVQPSPKPAPDPPPEKVAAAAAAPRPVATSAAPVVQHEPAPVAATERPDRSHPAGVAAHHHKAKPAGPSSFRLASAAAPLHRVAADAAGLFHAVAPPTPAARPDSADPSRAMVYPLLVALGVMAAFVLWPQRREWLRRVHPRTRLRG